MNQVNPRAVLLIALLTVVGGLFGRWLAGLAMGLGIVFVASLDLLAYYDAWLVERRRRRRFKR